MKIFSSINFSKLKNSLDKTRTNIITKISEAITHKVKIDEETIENLEEILIDCDLGSELVEKVINNARNTLINEQDRSVDNIKNIIKDELLNILGRVNNVNYSLPDNPKPYVILIVGVNGSGKTTTIGKLAYKFKTEGKKVIIASGDTFRAAANDQLKSWASLVGVDLIEGNSDDPAAVVFDTISKAIKNDYDIVLIDTAGRLHNNINLMNELSKIKKVVNNIIPLAPHETLLVLDGNLGQNTLMQAEEFRKYSQITGLIITKLDGTAKGGAVFQICAKNNIPIFYIGIGEKLEDLQIFDSQAYVNAVFS